jgi:hypothetical protein
LDIERLHFLRESYFSWYEFQINSAYAWLVSCGVYSVTVIVLATHWSIATCDWFGYIALPVFATTIVVPTLWSAARLNLFRYEERFLFFLAGTLCLVAHDKS